MPEGKVTEKLLQEIAASFNSRDVERIVSHFTEDCTFLMARGPEPAGRRIHGKDQLRKVLADRFKVIPDMRWEHLDDWIAGDKAVTVWRVKGRSKDGETLDYQGCDLWEFRGDKVLHKDTYWKIVEDKERL